MLKKKKRLRHLVSLDFVGHNSGPGSWMLDLVTRYAPFPGSSWVPGV